jgi:N-acetylmuramoyl-L-alanine amidase
VLCKFRKITHSFQKILAATVCLIVGLSTYLLATTYLETPVTFNNTKLAMESPLVRIDDTLYMPMREWVIALDGHLSYLRKEDAYEIKVSQNNSIVIAPYSPELWVSGRQHFMQHPAVFVDRQLYLPLEEFAWVLGAKATIATAGVTIRFSGMPTPPASVTKATKQATILATREESKVMMDQIQIPDLQNRDNPILEIAGKRFPLKNIHRYHEDKLYVDFSTICSALGGNISPQNNHIQMVLFGKTFLFPTTGQTVKIKDGQYEETRYIADVVYQHGKTPMLSLQAIASVLGLQPQWQSGTQTLVLASRLRLIQLQERDNSLALLLKTSIPISPIIPTADGQVPRFEIAFPSTVLSFPSGEILSPRNPLSALRWRQEGNTSYLMVIYDEEGSSLTPSIHGDTLIFSFQNKVSHLRQVNHEGYPAIEVSATYPFGIRGWMLDAHRLVLDLPDTISDLPLTIPAVANTPYKKIRTSQFSWTPLSARIVIDMSKQTGYTIIKKDAQTWRIVFDEKASAGTKSTPVISSPSKTPKPKIIATAKGPDGALRNKTIFIDPGHGGNDPGAIGPNDEYEKEFTLDISLRLGKLLTAQGAQVVYARTDDSNPTLQERVEMSAKAKASLFVSVHINSFFHSFAHGTETYYFKSEDKPLAEAIHPEVMKVTQGKNNGLKRARLYVLRNSSMPAVLIEPLFLTNKDELAKLKTPEFRQGLAEATLDGILRYYGR